MVDQVDISSKLVWLTCDGAKTVQQTGRRLARHSATFYADNETISFLIKELEEKRRSDLGKDYGYHTFLPEDTKLKFRTTSIEEPQPTSEQLEI